jgi:hypothetical protein
LERIPSALGERLTRSPNDVIITGYDDIGERQPRLLLLLGFVHDELVPRFARLSAKGVRIVDWRDSVDFALLLYRHRSPGPRASSVYAHAAADLDALSASHGHADSYCYSDRYAPLHAYGD